MSYWILDSWVVHPGHEEEFLAAWTALMHWTMQEVPGKMGDQDPDASHETLSLFLKPHQMLKMLENALVQPSKSSSTKHHTLDEFYSRHLALYLSIAVNECSPGQDSRFISLQASGKMLEFLDTAGFHLAQPGAEVCSLTSMDEVKKLLHELIERHGSDAGLAQSQEFFLLFLRQILKRVNEEPNRFLRGKMVQDSSTERQYYLRVPPSIYKADEAVAWTFGLAEKDYQPGRET